MRSFVLTWFLFAAACVEGPEEHAELRQGLGVPGVVIGVPTIVFGTAGDQLGSRLATCADGTVISAAPGRPGLWALDGGMLVLPGDAGAWTEVACVTPMSGAAWVAAAGPAGVVRHQASAMVSWQLLEAGAFSSLAGGPRGVPLLAGKPTSEVRWFDANTASLIPQMTSGEDAVDALAWFQEGDGFLVGSSRANATDVWSWDGGAPSLRQTLFLNPGFGRAVAGGNVSPRPGVERLIGGQGSVWIIADDGSTLAQLESGAPDFGEAIALGPSRYRGLQALWVSEPSTGRILFFTGDAGGEVAAMQSPGFGKSLAWSNGNLFVGAPLMAPGGAVILTPVSLSEATDFVLTECAPSTCMRGSGSGSCVGVCVGGVVCDYDGCSPDAGRPDAGMRDAGAPDAGTVIDAGAADAGMVRDAGSDAGTSDAGSNDAGTVRDAGSDAGTSDAGADAGPSDAGWGDTVLEFSASGCSALGGSPLLCLVLLALRPRVRARARAARRTPR
ncbi:MAG: hypothetical protein ACOZQL_02345 [Myxococcota bacterium]